MLTYGLESLVAVYAINLKPDLDIKDYILGCIIILGSFLILLMPPRRTKQLEPKQYMTD